MAGFFSSAALADLAQGLATSDLVAELSAITRRQPRLAALAMKVWSFDRSER